MSTDPMSDHTTPLRVVISTLIEQGAGVPNDVKLEAICEALDLQAELLDAEGELLQHDELDDDAQERLAELQEALGTIGGRDARWLAQREQQGAAPRQGFLPDKVTEQVMAALGQHGFAAKATPALKNAIHEHCVWQRMLLDADEARARKDARGQARIDSLRRGTSITPKRRPRNT